MRCATAPGGSPRPRRIGRGGLAKVLTGSALTQDDFSTAVGIRRAGSRFAGGRDGVCRDRPLRSRGIVESIEIMALASRFQAARIDPLTRTT